MRHYYWGLRFWLWVAACAAWSWLPFLAIHWTLTYA